MIKQIVLSLIFCGMHSTEAWSADKVLSGLFYDQPVFEQYYQLDISDLEKLPRLDNKRKRQNWWPNDYEPIKKWENTGIKFEGYFHGAEYVTEFWSKPESQGILVYFGDYPHASDKRKILRCYIPDPLKQPTWTIRNFTKLTNYNARVIIYGRLLWDNYLSKDWVFVIGKIEAEQNNVYVEL